MVDASPLQQRRLPDTRVRVRRMHTLRCSASCASTLLLGWAPGAVHMRQVFVVRVVSGLVAWRWSAEDRTCGYLQGGDVVDLNVGRRITCEQVRVRAVVSAPVDGPFQRNEWTAVRWLVGQLVPPPQVDLCASRYNTQCFQCGHGVRGGFQLIGGVRWTSYVTARIGFDARVVQRRMHARDFVGWINPPYPPGFLLRVVAWIERCDLTVWLLMPRRDDECGRRAVVASTQHLLIPAGVRLFLSSSNGYRNAAMPCPFPTILCCFDRRPAGTKPLVVLPTLVSPPS